MITTASLALGVSLTTTTAEAALLRSLSLDSQSRALADQFDSVAFFKASNSVGQTVWGSGVLLDPKHILTAAHQVPSPTSTGTIFFAGNGSNYNSDPGVTAAVTGWARHPSYIANNGNTIDLAIVTLATPIGDRSLDIASAAAGEALTGIGYGRYGDTSTGPLQADGNARAWQAPVRSFVGGDGTYSSSFYQSAAMSSSVSLALNGQGLSGDSGGPWFTTSGALVGITVAGSTIYDGEGFTIYAKLSSPDVRSWIVSQVPEPSGLAIATCTAVTSLARRHRKL